MGRYKGTPKTGGRLKGTGNKCTAEIKLRLSEIISRNVDEINEFLLENEDEKVMSKADILNFKLELTKCLLPYVLSKKQESRISVDDETVVSVTEAMTQINKMFDEQE